MEGKVVAAAHRRLPGSERQKVRDFGGGARPVVRKIGFEFQEHRTDVVEAGVERDEDVQAWRWVFTVGVLAWSTTGVGKTLIPVEPLHQGS